MFTMSPNTEYRARVLQKSHTRLISRGRGNKKKEAKRQFPGHYRRQKIIIRSLRTASFFVGWYRQMVKFELCIEF